MSRFTKGPWAGKRIDIAVHHFEAIGATIAFTGKSEEAMANAALIAAAPELLGVLKVAEGFVSEVSEKTGFGQVHTLEIIRAAIAKAEGGKS